MTPEQREMILNIFPRPRKKPVVENNGFLDALFYITNNGCPWRSLPALFGPWHTIYVRVNR
ncbi:MAG: transposase [Treponema sp.]|nr:transposase [Treponema sp.]